MVNKYVHSESHSAPVLVSVPASITAAAPSDGDDDDDVSGGDGSSVSGKLSLRRRRRSIASLLTSSPLSPLHTV